MCMSRKTLFINAMNIHSGGGRSLLQAVLEAIPLDTRAIVLVDSRFKGRHIFHDGIEVRYIKATIMSRLNAEYSLSHRICTGDAVLYFGSLPPLFKLCGHVTVFMQNRYLIDNLPLEKFSIKHRIRILLERLWLLGWLKNVDAFIVQTPTMKKYLDLKNHKRVPIKVLPFVSVAGGYIRNAQKQARGLDVIYDFLYVASGEPHKNHRNLLEAWCLLAMDGLFPSLCLTLDEIYHQDLCTLIEDLQTQHGVIIKNLGTLTHQEVLDLYKKSSAAIYPSKFESLGLPLIEARQAGLPVLAGELDYVRDVLDPEQVFDPESPVSIARAVKRFLGVSEKSLPVLSAIDFLNRLVDRDSE